MIIGKGLINIDGETEEAIVRETKRGTEYAELPNGLLALPLAYEPEEVYEANTPADIERIDAILAARRAG